MYTIYIPVGMYIVYIDVLQILSHTIGYQITTAQKVEL